MFADHLRSWSPGALSELLAARPDLLARSDDGFDALARKASTPMSIGLCLVRADIGMLVVAEALAITSPATAEELASLLGTDDLDAVVDALLRLQRWGLVIVEGGVARPVGPLSDLLRRPLGLGPSIVEVWDRLPPAVVDDLARIHGVDGARERSVTARAVARRMADPEAMARLLAEAPEGIAEVVDALVAQRAPAVGLPAGHPHRDPDPDEPLGWLLDRGMLVAVDGVAELPREVVLALSPDGLAPRAVLRPIEPRPVPGLAADAVAAAAGDQASRALEGAEALLRIAADGEIGLRRSGGVGVREVRRLAKLTDLEPRDVGRLLELLSEAGLVRAGERTVDTTGLAPAWLGLARARRWLVLVKAWVGSPRFLSRALSLDEDGRPLPALGDTDPLAAPFAGRQVVLGLLASLQPGEAWEPDQIAEAAVWRSPNVWGRGEHPPEALVSWTLEEAALLGLTALDGPTPALSAVAEGDHEALVRAAEAAVGQDQTRIVIQNDLTAVALGPLDPEVGAELSDFADRVPGHSVPTFRFTEATLRRGLDRGWTAAGIEELLADHSLSGLPQPLRYLLADVDRRYGSVRILGGSSVIVAEDEATAVDLASRPKAARLGLRLVAPTVLIGDIDPLQLLEELRAEGLFPVLDGSTVAVGPSRAGGRHPETDETFGKPGSATHDLPADWTGPALDQVAVAGEVAEAVEALVARRREEAGGSHGAIGSLAGPGPGLERLLNRPAAVTYLRQGELVEVRGILLGVTDTLTLLDDDGLVDVEVDAVVTVEDPTR